MLPVLLQLMQKHLSSERNGNGVILFERNGGLELGGELLTPSHAVFDLGDFHLYPRA